MQKRKLATNRVAIGPIWTILCAQRAMFLGYILGPFPAPGEPKNGPKKPNNFFQQNLETSLSLSAFSPSDLNPPRSEVPLWGTVDTGHARKFPGGGRKIPGTPGYPRGSKVLKSRTRPRSMEPYEFIGFRRRARPKPCEFPWFWTRAARKP